MRGLDCPDTSHGVMHVSAEDDERLFEKVKEHTARYHPEMGDDEVRSLISQLASDE